MSGTGISSESCPVCSSGSTAPVLELAYVPVHCNRLWQTHTEALAAPSDKIALNCCDDCGHIYNRAFDPALMKYDAGYENPLHFSPRFREYAEGLAESLIEKYHIKNKTIIELGCGDGHFLTLLCRLGNNQGVGFDKSHTASHENSDRKDNKITFIPDFFSEKYAHYEPDFICCRHVLEHIHKPHEFLSGLRNAIGKQTVVFFEVPNSFFVLHDSIWDIIYEHYSYYNEMSIATLFRRTGFEISDVYDTYEEQFLCVEAVASEHSAKQDLEQRDKLHSVSKTVAGLSERYHETLNGYKKRLNSLMEENKKVVLWGGGSKGVSLLNMLQIKNEIEYVVDINPGKHGKFIPCSGQKIIPPEELRTYKPDAVLIMNPIYKNEIREMTNRFGLTPDIIT